MISAWHGVDWALALAWLATNAMSNALPVTQLTLGLAMSHSTQSHQQRTSKE